MPFAQRFETLYREVFLPALTNCGYEAKRADTDPTTSVITADIERGIAGADLVLCEMTGRNPNVFYELALAHTLRKPSILLWSGKSKDVPFDIRGVGRITYSRERRDWKRLLRAEIERAAGAATRDLEGAPLQHIGKGMFREAGPEIQKVLHLFRECLCAFSTAGAEFRVFYHRLHEDGRRLQSWVQDRDSVYPDADFECVVTKGVKQSIVICRAVSEDRFLAVELPSAHKGSYYPNSAIPKDLVAVMAAPVRVGGKIRGVVALDSFVPMTALGLTSRKLGELFMEVSGIVGKIVASTQA